MTTPKKALKMADKFQFAISLLVIHGLMPDSERAKVRARLDKWAFKHRLRRAATPGGKDE